MDVESSSAGKSRKPRTGRYGKKKVCLWLTLWVLILLMLLAVILCLTLFKPKKPVTTVNSISLNDLQVSLDVARITLRINLTLDAHLTVKNPNRFGFTHDNFSAFLDYRGDVVGEAPFPTGKIPPGGTVPINASLSIMADRLLSNSTFYSDVVSGSLPFSAYTRIPGRVSILGIGIHVVCYTTCDLIVSVSNRTISDYRCTYKNK